MAHNWLRIPGGDNENGVFIDGKWFCTNCLLKVPVRYGIDDNKLGPKLSVRLCENINVNPK